MTGTEPEIVVVSDYDGYFEGLVRRWVHEKAAAGGEFRHRVVSVSAGPYRMDAVTCRSDGETLHVDFYSALRVGFGGLSADEVEAVKRDWL